MDFSIPELYTLKLSWSSVIYNREGVCDLIDAQFSGPALSIAEKIAPNNGINLDFFKQYYILAHNIYIGKLTWGDVIYNKDNTVTLKNASISHDKLLNKMPKFNDTDSIFIDTVNHEAAVHRFNLVYTSYVVNCDNVLYKFW